MRTDALFVTYDAGGNVAPLLGIAQRFRAEGGSVAVLGSSATRAAVEQAGLPFRPFSTAQAYTPTTPIGILTNLSQMVRTTAGAVLERDVTAAVTRTRPRIVVVDCMLLAAIRAAVGSGVPTVTVVHTLPSFFAGPYAHGPVGMVSIARGLRPGRVWSSAHSSIATTVPELDPTADRTPFTDLHLVGPVTARVDSPAPVPRPRARQRVLVSLSTNWFPGQDRTMADVVAALGELDVDAVVTTGRSIDPTTLAAPDNVEVHRFLDHEAVLAEVDLVIGHGGHGTTLRALAHGVPLLVLPSFGFADQPAVGRRVAELGVGLTLRRGAGAAAVRAAVTDLLRPGPHRDAAAALGVRLRALDPAGDAAAHLRAVAAR